jgi:hypothetical protein
VIHRVEGFPIEEQGMLRFEVLLNGKYGASHEVDISMMGTSDSPATAETS